MVTCCGGDLIAGAFTIGDDGIAGIGAGGVSSSRVRDRSLSVGVVACGTACCCGGDANAGFDGHDGEAMALLMAYLALAVVISAVEMAMLKASSAVVEVSLVVSRSGVFANDLCLGVLWP